MVAIGGADAVSVSLHGAATTWVCLGHGAGGTRRTPFLLRCAEAIVAGGRAALLFNFCYSDRGRRIPDPPALLERAVAAVSGFARDELGARRLVLGGKSMGGRIASQAVAKGLAADGLVFLGYPLHPPGQPDRRRDAHLPDVAAPMLFVQGTRDGFARADLLAATLRRLGERATLLAIEGGGHSFELPRRAGRSPAEVERSIFEGIASWLDARSL